jgi:hypothetical protein
MRDVLARCEKDQVEAGAGDPQRHLSFTPVSQDLSLHSSPHPSPVKCILYIYTYSHICMYVCMYVCMHACMHVYTHIYLLFIGIRMLCDVEGVPRMQAQACQSVASTEKPQ